MSTVDLVSHTRRLAYGSIVVALICTLVLMILTEETQTDGAMAGVGAALIGIAGTSLGHTVGFHRERRRSIDTAGRGKGALDDVQYAIVAAAIIVVLLLLPGVALLIGDLPRVSTEAAAALIAALVGVSATDLAHRNWLSRSDRWWLGHALLGAGLLGGLVFISTNDDQADVIAAIATTAIAVGGTVIGFAHGRRTAKAVHTA
jgi:hypothetical protein